MLAHTNSKGQLIQPNAKPGDVRYVDYNDDGQITDADRQHCGSTIPKFHLSSTINLEYKGFDLMALLNSSFGNKLFNGPRSAYDRFDDNSNYRANYDPWSPTNVNAKDPRPIYGDARNVRGGSGSLVRKWKLCTCKSIGFGIYIP